MQPRLAMLPLLALLVAAAGCGDTPVAAPPACTKGDLGCACLPRNTCNRGPDGVLLACLDATCQPAVCTAEQPGLAGCACQGDVPCAAGHLCLAGSCVVDTGQSYLPPATPRCYTPCRGDLLAPDGSLRRCEHDGLLEGCLGGALCRTGTCVVPRAAAPDDEAPAAPPGACAVDADCPDFQACIQGACYADCQSDRDCRPGRLCHRRTCRLPCTTVEDSCPAETVCSSIDGEEGFCLPVTPSPPDPAPPFEGTFELSSSALEFSSQALEQRFTLTNHAATAETFTLRKVKHRTFSDAGPQTITEQPLHWLGLGAAGSAAQQVAELAVEVAGGAPLELVVTGADNPVLDRWDGELEVSHPQMGTQRLGLRYARSPEGQWIGSMHYVANFPDAGLAAWVQDRSNRDALRAVGNAFIRRWGALRDSRISYQEFRAALTAMLSESWKWDSVRARCPSASAPDPNVGCYLYENSEGLSVFSDYLPDAPIPTGVVSLPIAMNLRATPQSGAGQWSGKILTREALHYTGDPAVALHFATDPNSCSTSVGSTCLTFVDGFSAVSLVGGRYATTALDQDCALAAPGSFELVREPWLIPGFTAGTDLDVTTGARYRHECRDTLLPFGAAAEALNLSAAAANPIPDGATRRRHLELVDGALIDQQTLFLIFREHLPSFLDPHDSEGFSSYGFMELTRTRTQLGGADYQGSAPVDFRPPPAIPGVQCSAALLDRVLDAPGSQLDASNASAVAVAVVEGVLDDAEHSAPVLDASSAEKVHYLCVDTGYFDGGPLDDGSPDAVRVPCPEGSRVEFFTLRGAGASQAAVAALACQQGGGICRAGEPCEFEITGPESCPPPVCTQDAGCSLSDVTCVSVGCEPGQPCPQKGNCEASLLAASGAVARDGTVMRRDLVWRCDDPDRVVCDESRLDLRQGKTFFAEGATAAIFRSLDDDIAEAFRYKTRFRNRAGRSVGFAPQVCVGDAFPYCYDPQAIEAIRARVDCATHIYTQYYDALDAPSRATLKDYLARDFAYALQPVEGLATPVVIDGFERLHAELLITMGDESFTAAFASRFDLAGQKLANFEGDLFEPTGLNLSGGAGFEMYSLYQAAQYYQLTLDRFYRQASVIWDSLDELPAGQGFVTQATTVSYFDRLIRASAQKTRVWSEIAKRYEAFNRPDLARRVIERAYAQASMESTVLSQMMRKVGVTGDAAAEAQITRAVEMAQHTYRAALLDMRNVYHDISDAVTFYGLPPDYIPFPALDPGDSNAFTKVMARAREVARVAADKEQRALSESRSFDTDSALFQAELGRIRDESESRLGEICGTFTATDGDDAAVYPAIPRYAHLSELTRLLGDPCGLVGNGELYDGMLALRQAQLDFEGIQLAHRNLMQAAIDAQDRASAQCQRIVNFASYTFATDTQILAYEDTIHALDLAIDTTKDFVDGLGDTFGMSNCEMFGCIANNTKAAAYMGIWIASQVIVAASRATIVGLERSIGDLEAAKAQREILEECGAAQIDVVYEVKDLMRQGLELQLEVAKLQYSVQLALSNLRKLRNEATATMAGQAENEEMAINIEAARNDPNVRIYRNDAVAAADRTFQMTLREAYRATKVFEYYTSQSYAAFAKLFLVRMVANGDVTLEAYLDELEAAFVEFQESYGNPDLRVTILSLRDDVLRIPRLDDDGVALDEAERTRRLRAKLQDASLLDARGYLVMPFSTSMGELSPLTRNHKVRFIEAEIVGDDVGDALGRVYVTQRGTGVVRAVDAGTLYYAFPERTAVVNPFFNGSRPLAPEVYRNERLRDRPYINTGWDLVFNQRDERVNADIALGALIDVRLYVYYTDFTEL